MMVFITSASINASIMHLSRDLAFLGPNCKKNLGPNFILFVVDNREKRLENVSILNSELCCRSASSTLSVHRKHLTIQPVKNFEAQTP